tara:strand:+ start:85 stop:513 length:429 start_codon:yes stop_codon:yes gene_type:complete
MKTVLTLLMVLITSTTLSQKDRVDIYKVKKQIVKSYTTKSYNVTEMYLALRFEKGTNELEEVQIIHKSLNKTEKYYVTSSERSTEDDDYYGQVYYTIKNVADNKYSKIMLTLDLNNEFVRILPSNINKSYTYILSHYKTLYK